jgi:hypothetical protein
MIFLKKGETIKRRKNEFRHSVVGNDLRERMSDQSDILSVIVIPSSPIPVRFNRTFHWLDEYKINPSRLDGKIFK